MTEMTHRLREKASNEGAEYAHGEDRPLGGYLAAMGTYGAIVAGLAALARMQGRRLPDRVSPWEVGLMASATHRLSRMITKDTVTSPLRAPFTSYEGTAGPSELSERVRGHGVRHTVGELLTCPFCAGMWVSTGFYAGLVFFPRGTRLAAATLASLDMSDFLQFGYVRAQAKSSR
jgi:hypothetical protein